MVFHYFEALKIQILHSPYPPAHTHTHTGERISLWDIKDFPLRLWLVFIICVFYYVTVFPFIGLAT